MLTDDDIRQEISSAQRGSDIHGLVETIAYLFHLKNGSRDADADWHAAQDVLLKWSDSEYRRHLREGPNFGAQITSLLNNNAHSDYLHKEFFREQGDSYNDWMEAQKQLAKQVLWQQIKLYV